MLAAIERLAERVLAFAVTGLAAEIDVPAEMVRLC